MTRSLSQALVAVVLFCATPLAAQRWPLPANTPNTDVPCIGCPGAKAGRPTKGYTAPIVSFTGRYLDSTMTRDLSFPFRTARAATGILIVPSLNRVYMRMGSAVFSYALDTFFTRLSSREPLFPAAEMPLSLPNSSAKEFFLEFDSFFYAEDASTGWVTARFEGQERLGTAGNRGYDVDEEGYVYVAYTAWGWGIVKDPFTRDGAMMQSIVQLYDLDFSPGVVLHARGATARYAFVSDASQATDVYDVTDRARPVRLRRLDFGINRYAKAGDRIAIIDGLGHLSISTVDQLASGARAPLTLPGSTRYAAVTSDGTNFYAVSPAGAALQITTLRPAGTSYLVKHSRIPVIFTTISEIQYGAGLLTVTGASTGWDLAVFRVEPNGFTQVPLANYFPSYYSFPPTGYVVPDYANILDGLTYAQGGRLHLLVAAYGLGDVYELSLAAQPATCTLSCGGSAPLIAEVNEPVSFRADSAARETCGPLAYTWRTADGATPITATDTLTHTYTQAGAFNWTVTSSGAGATCGFVDTIAILRIARTDGNLFTERVVPAGAISVSSALESALTAAGPVGARVRFPEFSVLEKVHAQYAVVAFVEPVTPGTAPTQYELRVTDPNGIVTSSAVQSTDTAYLNGDLLLGGGPVTIVLADNARPGQYRIEVIPQAGGAPALMSIAGVSQVGNVRSTRILADRRPVTSTAILDSPTCSFATSVNTLTVPGTGATRVATVSAGSSCAWSASTTTPWITLQTTSGTGTAGVSYTVAPNPTPDRRIGSIVIAGQRFTVVQEGYEPPGRRRSVRR